MSFLKHWLGNKPVGFSLLELMVVVAILGVLATVAVPRFNIFRSRARQAESKQNLGQIFTLQESFAIEYERYYDGVAATWGGADMNNKANADGYQVKAQGAGAGGCSPTLNTNKLGFRLANCDKARYMYWIAGANETEFLSIAYALSDSTPGKRIFPGCDGVTTGVTRTNIAPGSTRGIDAREQCSVKFAAKATMTATTAGDAWCLDEGRKLNNYFDIVEGCE